VTIRKRSTRASVILLVLFLTATTLNVQSFMGVISAARNQYIATVIDYNRAQFHLPRPRSDESISSSSLLPFQAEPGNPSHTLYWNQRVAVRAAYGDRHHSSA
jgi:hypothetical protein